MVKLYDRKKLKICDSNGMKLDVINIGSEDDFKKALKRWKMKGFL